MSRWLIILVVCTGAVQAMRAEPMRAPNLPGGPVQKFFVPTRPVDGLPVYREEWRVWDAPAGVWVPMMSERGVEIMFGIKPGPPTVDVLPAPPIPKRQRRLE